MSLPPADVVSLIIVQPLFGLVVVQPTGVGESSFVANEGATALFVFSSPR